MGVAVGGLHDLVGRVLFRVGQFVELAADEALRGEDGVLGIGDGLALGGLADETLAVLAERHDGGRRARTLGVFEHHRLTAFHDGHARIRGAKVDS